MLIDGKPPKMKNGKYLLERNGYAKQITVKLDGYKDENLAVIQYKRTALNIIDQILIIPNVWSTHSSKKYKYDPIIKIGENMISLPKKLPENKEITLNLVSVKISPENKKYRIFDNYKKYLAKNNTTKLVSYKEEEKIEIQNTIFSQYLNETLKKKGT